MVQIEEKLRNNAYNILPSDLTWETDVLIGKGLISKQIHLRLLCEMKSQFFFFFLKFRCERNRTERDMARHHFGKNVRIFGAALMKKNVWREMKVAFNVE